MFGIGLPEMILILALALIVVGPDKLPDLARSVAKGVLELKKTVNALKEDLAEDNPFDAVKPELEETAESIKKQLSDVTPDGVTGVVEDLKEGMQEVIDSDGSVIPIRTEDIIKTVSEPPDTAGLADDSEANDEQAEVLQQSADGDDSNRDKKEISEAKPADNVNEPGEHESSSESVVQTDNSSDKPPSASTA